MSVGSLAIYWYSSCLILLADNLSTMEAYFKYLLCISGLDAIANRKIYETYMHSDQIAYTGTH